MTKSIFTQTRWLVTIILLFLYAVPKVWGAASKQVTLTFAARNANPWSLPTTKTTTSTSYTDGVYTITLGGGGSGNGHGWAGVGAGGGNTDYYLVMGKSGATLTLPAFTFTTTKIVVVGRTGASANVTQNIYVGSTAVSTATTGATGTYTYNINSSYQAAGTIYVLKVTNAYNTQITSIEIWGEAASCSVNPSATGDASINGSFTLTSLTDAVSVSSGTWGPGSNCSWTDYGFVWGTSSSLSTDNNKVQVGTTGNATSWATDASHKVQPSGSTAPTSWSVGTTYYVKAYGKNGKAGATYYYSTNAASFTLRSITYNSNGGSTVNTQYVNSGGTYSAPSAPTKDGYTFSNWCTNSTLTADMDWTAAISENKSLYAKWTANPYTISLDNQSATTPGDASISVTYDSNTNLTGTPAITVPKKTGYTFGGYYTSTGGSGDQIIDADGNVVASVSGYTSATKQWIYAGDKTLYAKWTIKNYTITWKVNGETWTPKTTTGEGTDGSDNANYNTAWSTLTLPTDPGASELTSCVADKFMGWTESENYESDSAPTDLLNSSNKASKTSKKITKNTTFYAVFADYGE